MERTASAAAAAAADYDDDGEVISVDVTKSTSPTAGLPVHPQSQTQLPNNPHRRTVSGASLLSKLPFMRSLSDGKPHHEAEQDAAHSASASMSTITQQKSRRRKGSLRKVALLGRGAQRERKEAKQLTIDTSHSVSRGVENTEHRSQSPPTSTTATTATTAGHDPLGLNISDLTPRPSMDGYASRSSLAESSVSSTSPPQPNENESSITSPTISYTSTTDEDDVLHIPNHIPSPLRPDLSLSSGAESYFASRRRRSILQAKSPLSYSGLSSTPLPPADADWDYSDTEWWGWVVLMVTWIVFVVGMGSVLGMWSWAWDVGTTPYAPPELEDDPTLPIVGYYPALIILTCIMAWVWVVVAWVGMKYFRHAKISGD